MIVGTRKEILARIGEAVKRERLRQNLTQLLLAERSGVSLNAVKNLEAGNGTALGTFVLVCRILGKDGWIRAISVADDEISPVEFVELLQRRSNNGNVRKRARRNTSR